MKNKKLGFRSSGVLELSFALPLSRLGRVQTSLTLLSLLHRFRSSDNSFTDENLHTKVSSELLVTPELLNSKKTNSSFALAALFVFLFSFFLASCQSEGTARLMSYNIRNGIGMDGVNNLQRVADVINACRPDVVAVQEVDSMTARSGRRDVLGELAALTGMMPVYAPAIDYDGGKYGVGILCRTQPLSVVRRALPGREESRMVVAAEFRDYVFACTHLSLTPADRMLSLPILQEVAALIPRKPFYLAGDFNAEPHEPFIRSLAERFTILTDTTVRTFPADVPDVTIDYIVKLGIRNEELEILGAANAKGETRHSASLQLTESRQEKTKSAVPADGNLAQPIPNSSFLIPNFQSASDHRPVCIDIIFKRK